MTTLAYEQLLEQVDALDVEEQLRLEAHLLERAREAVAQEQPRRKWRELRGLATYPVVGEDAQEWVTRTRRERGRRAGEAIADGR